ncbi:MAG: transporter substrate-binding domain-containing protein [Chloroflexi bacterium]|nr:MAG: transporter substrate-binding domain-containing protein [Chloroflexota bacterium]
MRQDDLDPEWRPGPGGVEGSERRVRRRGQGGNQGPGLSEGARRRVDAVWETDTAVADFRLKNPGKYDIAFTVPGDFKYGIYFGKGKTDVGTALTAALKALKDDGTLAALATKYNLDPANLDVIQ